MMFCPKCKSILLPRQERGKKILKCSCGYSAEGDVKLAESAPKRQEALGVGVADTAIEPHTRTEAECTKCGNREAYTWEVQTRAGDEPATRFFRCTKCRHTWREYR